MSNFVLSFRSTPGQTATATEEAAWGAWFQQLGAKVVDFGNRVGETSPLGNCPSDSRLSGYVVVAADDLEGAVALAKGCPGLGHGGGVEVGTIVDM